jgi:hypothetical protein
MPTYMCYAHQSQITAEQKSHIRTAPTCDNTSAVAAPVRWRSRPPSPTEPALPPRGRPMRAVQPSATQGNPVPVRTFPNAIKPTKARFMIRR